MNRCVKCQVVSSRHTVAVHHKVVDMDAPSHAKEKPADVGSVADFVDLVNRTVGKHFKCCICFRSVGSATSGLQVTRLDTMIQYCCCIRPECVLLGSNNGKIYLDCDSL